MLEKFDHVPRPSCCPALPTAERFNVDFMSISSLKPVTALTAGEAERGTVVCVGLGGKAFCKRFSMRDKCSKMSLSPASSLIPGSR